MATVSSLGDALRHRTQGLCFFGTALENKRDVLNQIGTPGYHMQVKDRGDFLIFEDDHGAYS